MTETVAAVVDAAVRRLVAAGWTAADARIDVGALARAGLGWDLAAWLARQRDVAPPYLSHELRAAVARRERHEPVAYITGEREFYGRPFKVTSDVLIPRPETELLVETALTWLGDRRRPVRVLEVGVGSGCIIVTLACERTDLDCVATDLSPAALAIARENARRLGVEDRIAFVEGSLFAGRSGPWDLVVSNPPYIALSDRPTLAADVRDYEPALALYGGEDGLAVVRAVVNGAADGLAPGGALMMEIGAGQAPAVADLLKATKAFDTPALAADLQGIPRTVLATRR